MRLLLATEARLRRARDGVIYADGLHGRAFFDRYLTVFDEVLVVARVEPTELTHAPTAAHRVEDEWVRVCALPDYRGVRGVVGSRATVARLAMDAAASSDAAVLRAPGHVASAVHGVLGGLPYAVEVVGDPAEVFRRGASNHPARAAIRVATTRSLRRLTAGAAAVGYVSGVALPDRYPAAPGVPTEIYSSVSLTPDSFLPARPAATPVRRLVTVTSLEQPYKGVDVLLAALAELDGDVTLTIVGDGRLRRGLEAEAARLGLAGRVVFTGNLPGPSAVRRVLAESDAFVLASRTEGLPRAMLEAMAAGLPCVGTRVGGIPELLPETEMCAPGDAAGLAALLGRLVDDPSRAARLGAVLQEHARSYAADILQARRDLLLRALRDRAASATSSG